MKRADVIEAALFLPAMAALAGLVFLGGWGLIVGGAFLLESIHAACRAVGIPPVLATIPALLGTIFLIGVVLPHYLGRLVGLWQDRKRPPP